MELFNLSEFDFPALASETLLFQQRVKELLDAPPTGYKVIQADGEYINNAFIKGVVYLGPGAEIKPFTVIEGRVIVGPGTIIGPQCSIKGDVVIGRDCRLGRCEVDNSVIMNNVKAYHHSYVGHSIIGNRVNISAGFITANLRLDGANIKVKGLGDSCSSKLGALIGDDTKTMINACLMPGSVVKPCSIIYSPKPSEPIAIARSEL